MLVFYLRYPRLYRLTCLTVCAIEPVLTEARVSAPVVDARSIVFAGARGALFNVCNTQTHHFSELIVLHEIHVSSN